ncbi:hypothetical protein DENSPDRAFT_887159, partial [Dentipellis sp. KUC8613]
DVHFVTKGADQPQPFKSTDTYLREVQNEILAAKKVVNALLTVLNMEDLQVRAEMEVRPDGGWYARGEVVELRDLHLHMDAMDEYD